MTAQRKLLQSILSGKADSNVRFRSLRSLLQRLGFLERVRGDHWIYVHPEVDEIINLQPRGALAKPYQVKQVREILLRYKFVDPQP